MYVYGVHTYVSFTTATEVFPLMQVSWLNAHADIEDDKADLDL